MNLTEQIQEGHNSANEVIKVVKGELEKLKHNKTAIACFKDELYMQLEKLLTPKNT